MNEITKIFKTEEFDEVRIIMHNNIPYAVGIDVARNLGYKNPYKALQDNVYPEDRAKLTFVSSGQKRSMICVNEYGLYKLMFGSNIPTARKFVEWVTHEVLPQVLRTGTYSVRPQLTAEQEDKIIFAEQISTCEGDIDVQRFAEILSKGDFKIGRTELFRWLREHKYVMKAKNRINRPYQKYISAGYFKVGAEYTVNSKNETVRKIKVYITPLGQLALTSKIIKSFLPPITKYQIKLF